MKKKQEIIDMIHGDQPVLLHFYMTDCKKQEAIKSTLRRLQKTQKEAGINTINIEIRKQPKLVDELEIEGAPTVLLYTHGQEKWRRAGEVSEGQILRALERFKD